MSKIVINTKHAPEPIGPYSQAIKMKNVLFVSGQIAINAETGQLINTNIGDETHQVMKNISAILKEAGLDIKNIVKTTIFLKNMNDFGIVNEVYGSYFETNFPARETIEVSRLPKDVNVEISVIAG
ncbi:MAG: RidA family protein [Bacteroidia bacterium]|nr:RidA family protein [Bacteroidia bacterium]MCZ2277590.1 RidA family protein [Bacteroidia bacterium]